MYTESMALTGKMKFCIICTDFSNSLGIDSMGNPSTGSMYAGWLFNQCPVINQHRCETLSKWLPMNSLYLGAA